MTNGHLQHNILEVRSENMVSLGKKIVKFRIPILIIGFLLLIPSAIGYINTKANYDILYYLPEEIETMKGQNILKDDFKTGAFSMYVVEGMEYKDVSSLKAKIEDVDHVKKVIWYDTLSDLAVPVSILPQKVRDAFTDGDATMMMIIFDDTTSSESTMNAIEKIRSISNKQCFLSGMSAVVTDTKNLSNKETPIYVLIAVILSCLVLGLTMDSFLAPLLFLLSIGMAIVYNLGSNYLTGEISYVTKALSAVLQLGVTMDYSIFLWHSYKEQCVRYQGDKNRAMAHAISGTITAITGSSITTIAGFIALCFMSFTLGMDLGIVMAKGVVFGLISCVTILPSLILVFDKALEHMGHRELLPDLKNLSKFVTKRYYIFIGLFILLLAPALFGYTHTDVYYDLAGTLPKDLASVQANDALAKHFDMNCTHMLLIDRKMSDKDTDALLKKVEKVDGVKWALGLSSVIGPSVPKEVIPDSLMDVLNSDKYQLIVVNSKYKVASDEVNSQITDINNIIKGYSENNMIVGEGPCTKDLISITDEDFKMVSAVSIGVIFLIIAIVFKSISLPILLVAVIEFAIFINMGIPYYTGTTIPFIASIVIGTIQLGSTVDYAILMTTRYRKEQYRGASKMESIEIAHQASVKSIFVSALSFFAATFGVGLYSNIDMISSLCTLMARGALISMFVVIFVLPSVFVIFDKIICHTSHGFLPKKI